MEYLGNFEVWQYIVFTGVFFTSCLLQGVIGFGAGAFGIPILYFCGFEIDTAIAAIMELLNHLQKAPQESPQDVAIMREAVESVLLLLNPITPHICHTLWHVLGHQDDIELAPWPKADKEALVEDEKLIIVQVVHRCTMKKRVAPRATPAGEVLASNFTPGLASERITSGAAR